jgi:1,4-alpha-glucan branching enzyme
MTSTDTATHSPPAALSAAPHPPVLSALDLHLFGEGNHFQIYEVLGAHVREVNGVAGVHFAVWAPNARSVSVVGDFNQWSGDADPMQPAGSSGIWERFVPGLRAGAIYKFRVFGASGMTIDKADPFGFFAEVPPRTASIVAELGQYRWGDHEWMRNRSIRDPLHQPISIYEVHLGSWRHQAGNHNGWVSYREVAAELVEYCQRLGFTHIELLPVSEHPFTGSWGYQTVGYYSATSRYGTPDGLMYLIDYCHQHGIGVIIDWVPAHFPKDAHGLARFDGTALYEHADPRQGEHPDWNTLVFNYGRNEVSNFLIANALFWLDKYHIDGLRVDAVASMLYLDYSRKDGEWIPNQFGGRENLAAIEFLKRFNEQAHARFPGVLTIAEESTAWPGVSRPTFSGGLGFSLKWNMGWMNDTLRYVHAEPVHRKYHHNELTFSLIYAFTENFLLPLSHDEVVHGKGALLDKMPGDLWQRFANLRLLYSYMWTHPGKKLLFMGGEFGQWREWNCDAPLDWQLLDYPEHRNLQNLVGDLNRLYRGEPALHELDFSGEGFEWIDCHNAGESVLTYLRFSAERRDHVVVCCNFTPVVRRGYRVGVPALAGYREIFNSDSAFYGGSNVGNGGGTLAQAIPAQGRPHSICLDLPPLAACILKPLRD